jgi:hypothetical protein
MPDYPKSAKRSLRELAWMAYEQEMRSALRQLGESFDAWRAGQIDIWELDQRIHKYHNGPARELYNQYNESRVDMLVAYAIVRGIIRQDRVPAELGPYLERPLAFYRSLEQRSPADSPVKQSDEAELDE